MTTHLVGRPGTHGHSIDIDTWLLPHVDPDNGSIFGIGLGHFIESILITLLGWLSTTVNLTNYKRLNNNFV